ncbi:hypothetical protein K1719_003986 [Acacia pycnantha]|nr:hypothetical protein K1719_003986 [Acacia pycnantha]
MRVNTRSSSQKQPEMVRPVDQRQPPRQPQRTEPPTNPVGEHGQNEEDRLSQSEQQLEEPVIPNNNGRLEDNSSDTESSAPHNHSCQPQNSNPVINTEIPVGNPDTLLVQNLLAAMMRRIENMDKRHTLRFQRLEKHLKTRDSASSNEEEGSRRRQLAWSPRPPPTEYHRRRYVWQIDNNPFSDEILNARFPEKLNLTELTKYDGSQDPTTHLEDFEVVMFVRGLGEPIMTRIFAATLKGPALKWLHTLPIGEGKLRQYVIKTQGRKREKRKQGDRHDSLTPERRKDDKRPRPGSEEDGFPEAEFDCNVISGAFGGGGDTASQRRKYLKEVLSVRDRPKFKEDPDTTSKVERPQLLFTKEDMKDVVPGHQDGLDAFKRMNLDKEDLKPCNKTLVGFNGELSPPKGYIDLRLTLGTKEGFKTDRVRFIVAEFPYPYNIILGRPTIHKWDVLVSAKHQKIKMVSNTNRVLTIKGDQKESRQCYFETIKEGEKPVPPLSQPRDILPHSKGREKGQRSHPVNMVELDLRDEPEVPRPEPEGELEDLIVGDGPDQITKIDRTLSLDLRIRLEEFLAINRDILLGP